MDQATEDDPSSDAAASVQLPNLSSGQLLELQGILKNPVSGRQVMIPLTSKAFVIGSLQPDKDSSSDGGDEKLIVKDAGGNRKEVSRTLLCNLLEKERTIKKEMAKQKKQVPSKIQSATNDKTKTTTSVKQESAKKQSPPEQERKCTPTIADSGQQPPHLPYFDIKEEIDGSGKVVRSEAVNVTKQLELVSKQNQASQEEESKENMHGKMDTEEHSAEDDVSLEQYPVDETDTKSPVTDEQYEALSARLDELAKLEEEAEVKVAENQKSAKRLQSKGWSKGFLSGPTKQQSTPATRRDDNSDKGSASFPKQSLNESPSKQKDGIDTVKEKPIETDTKPTASKQKGRQKGWSKGFLNSSTEASKTSTKTTTARVKSDDEIMPKKVVSFPPNVEEVREIPKIGTTSVSSLKKAPAAIGPSVSNDDRPNVAPRPFDSSVFSGVVKERPIRQNQTPIREAQSSTSHNDDKPKKKLSKFAMERMQNR